MSSILRTLHQMNALVYDSVYGFGFNLHYIADYLLQHSNYNPMAKRNFSLPKIYTGGIDITNWINYSKEEQDTALKKDWYIYYSYRCPETLLLKRQTPIKGTCNSFKTKKERYSYLSVMRDCLEQLLLTGSNPYIENDFSFLDKLFNKSKTPQQQIKISKSKIAKIEVKPTPANKPDAEILVPVSTPPENFTSIKDAFEHTLKLKKNMMNETSYGNYKLRINKFLKFLPDEAKPITSITKKDALDFLNDILEKTSPRNRNNYRTDLSSFFSELENNEYIEQNFISKINVLKSNPERNKTFSDVKQLDIYEYLAENDTLLLLFIQFISYNFLRPVEVCRLKIKDIDLNENKLHVKAKNKLVKTKIIPKILIDLLPDLSQMNPEHYLFTPNGLGMEYEAKENNRRDYFSKRFNEVVKKKFNLNQDFGLYSFRHTFITKLYRKLRETNSQQVAKSDLMLITGHTTITALEKYLRDIDAELPEDYSNLLG